jgi:hypothetical protein
MALHRTGQQRKVYRGLGEELLNETLFSSLDQFRELLNEWKVTDHLGAFSGTTFDMSVRRPLRRIEARTERWPASRSAITVSKLAS